MDIGDRNDLLELLQLAHDEGPARPWTRERDVKVIAPRFRRKFSVRRNAPTKRCGLAVKRSVAEQVVVAGPSAFNQCAHRIPR